jgi:hypothetical protein
MTSADQLIVSLEGINANSFANEAERIRARDAVFEALRRIQSPWDIAWDHNCKPQLGCLRPFPSVSDATLAEASLPKATRHRHDPE